MPETCFCSVEAKETYLRRKRAPFEEADAGDDPPAPASKLFKLVRECASRKVAHVVQVGSS